MKTTTIAINNIGPVEEFAYEMAGPGLHILRGRQGAGKTTILRTVQLATDGRTDVKPTKRDGAPRGEATVAGRTIRIAKQVREEGELTVEGLGDLDIASLHTPKFVDAVTRDRHRIKVLARLGGAQADASLFHGLVGGKASFEELVDADALETDDLVEMAARVKRALEKAAQAREGQESTALANLRAQASIVEGVDLTAPHDDKALREELTAAVQARAQLMERRANGRAVLDRAEKAVEKLGSAVIETLVADAHRSLDAARDRVHQCADGVEQAREALASWEHRLTEARGDHVRATEALNAALERQKLAAAWQADIDAAVSVALPSDAEIAAAEKAVDDASKASEHGVRVRQARAAADQREHYREQAQKHGRDARRLRDAAKDTQDVLSAAIARLEGCPLRVKMSEDGDARLVVATDRSDTEAFDDLSDGERWPHIIRLAAGRNKLIVLPQAAFGELSPATRAQLHGLAAEHGCYILTAQVDDGELRAGMYQEASHVDAAAA